MPRIVAALRRCGRWFNQSQREGKSKTSVIGQRGEKIAAHFLRKQGYKILLKNVRLGRGEIDLLCRHDEVLVFVEVKTRADEKHGPPAAAVDAWKRRCLIHAAQLYLAELNHPQLIYRFDVVEVIGPWEREPVIRLLPNAFGEVR